MTDAFPVCAPTTCRWVRAEAVTRLVWPRLWVHVLACGSVSGMQEYEQKTVAIDLNRPACVTVLRQFVPFTDVFLFTSLNLKVKF